MNAMTTRTTTGNASRGIASRARAGRTRCARATFERARRTTRAMDERDRGDGEYSKPKQVEDALMESEAFSAALKAGFAVFLAAGAFFVFGTLAEPVLEVMIKTFPGAK